MQITRAILIYVLGVFFAAALLAYPLHQVLLITGVSGPAFHKLVTLLLKLMALVGLWPLLAVLRINERASWGFALPSRKFFLGIAKGFGAGLGILLILVTALFVVGARLFEQPFEFSWTDLGLILLKGLVAGLIVGLMEEVWFRGALFSALQRFGNAFAAVFVTAALYALVHFIRADVAVAPGEVNWLSGFQVLANCFGRYTSPAIVDSALALFAAGIFLSLIRYRTGNIALCIGMHAGWVVIIKVVKSVSQVDRDSDWFFLVGSYDGVIGLLAIVWLSVLTVAYYLSGKRS